MSAKSKLAVWIVIPLLVAAGLWLTVSRVRKGRQITLHGVVLREDADPGKQVPIADVSITAVTGDTGNRR
jgi:hypothetical protein